MKEAYEKPEILVIKVVETDIVTASPPPGGCPVELIPIP